MEQEPNASDLARVLGNIPFSSELAIIISHSIIDKIERDEYIKFVRSEDARRQKETRDKP